MNSTLNQQQKSNKQLFYADTLDRQQLKGYYFSAKQAFSHLNMRCHGKIATLYDSNLNKIDITNLINRKRYAA